VNEFNRHYDNHPIFSQKTEIIFLVGLDYSLELKLDWQPEKLLINKGSSALKYMTNWIVL
jgi:hypothetical protein